jgi:hypothetical protein
VQEACGAQRVCSRARESVEREREREANACSLFIISISFLFLGASGSLPFARVLCRRLLILISF